MSFFFKIWLREATSSTEKDIDTKRTTTSGDGGNGLSDFQLLMRLFIAVDILMFFKHTAQYLA